MPRSNKVALTLIFGLGIFDIGVGIGRVVTILQVNEEDFTWTQVPALQWLAIEPSIAIVVACMCVCRPLLEKLLPTSWRQTLTGSRLQAEDNIKLVSCRHGTVRSSVGLMGNRSGAGRLMVYQAEPEGLQHGAVHVRKDIFVTADSKV